MPEIEDRVKAEKLINFFSEYAERERFADYTVQATRFQDSTAIRTAPSEDQLAAASTDLQVLYERHPGYYQPHEAIENHHLIYTMSLYMVYTPQYSDLITYTPWDKRITAITFSPKKRYQSAATFLRNAAEHPEKLHLKKSWENDLNILWCAFAKRQSAFYRDSYFKHSNEQQRYQRRPVLVTTSDPKTAQVHKNITDNAMYLVFAFMSTFSFREFSTYAAIKPEPISDEAFQAEINSFIKKAYDIIAPLSFEEKVEVRVINPARPSSTTSYICSNYVVRALEKCYESTIFYRREYGLSSATSESSAGGATASAGGGGTVAAAASAAAGGAGASARRKRQRPTAAAGGATASAGGGGTVAAAASAEAGIFKAPPKRKARRSATAARHQDSVNPAPINSPGAAEAARADVPTLPSRAAVVLSAQELEAIARSTSPKHS